MALAKQLVQNKFQLPSDVFDSKGDTCYCSACMPGAGDNSFMRGQPPRKYTLPAGWCRLGLTVPAVIVAMNNVFENWHVAFHGTHSEKVPLIFRGGLQLLKAGDVALGGHELGIPDGHITDSFERKNLYTGETEQFDPHQVFTTPSIKYASHGAYAKPRIVPHPDKAGEKVTMRFVFQARQRPGSYKIGQETVGANHQGITLDPEFSNNELEYYTKENVSIVLHGLLVNLQFKSPPS
jgi:hypothetical protein